MATLQSGSAVIYTFPARGRFAVKDHRDAPQVHAMSPEVMSSSGWYHDEAIRETERTPKKN